MTVLTSTDNVRSITPDQISQLITLPVQRASVAVQVSTLIQSTATKTRIPLVTADPSAGWVAEGDEIGASDPTIDDIEVTPAKLAGLTIITNELAADSSPAAQSIVGDGLARDIATKLDAAFFGTNLIDDDPETRDPVKPRGLEDLIGVNAVTAPSAWTDLDPFEEAKVDAEGLGLTLGAFVAHPSDVLLLAQLKESSTSKRGLLTPSAVAATERQIAGVRLIASSAVKVGTVWGIPQIRSVIVQRTNVDLAVDRSAYFTSDRTAVRATMRIGWAFPQPAAIQKIKRSS